MCADAMTSKHICAVFQDDAVSCLVLGTEGSQILVLAPTANSATHIWQLKHVPAFLCASGQIHLAMFSFGVCLKEHGMCSENN